MINCLASCLVDFLGLRTKAAPSSFTSASVTGHLPAFIRLQLEPACVNNLQPDTLVGVFIPNSMRNLPCTVTTDFDSCYHNTHLAFWSWDAIFHNCGVKTTGGKTWKNANSAVSTLDSIADLNTFSFNFCASGLISSITLNSSIYLVFPLCYLDVMHQRITKTDSIILRRGLCRLFYDAGYRWTSLVVW
jgi:hypothetical protein